MKDRTNSMEKNGIKKSVVTAFCLVMGAFILTGGVFLIAKKNAQQVPTQPYTVELSTTSVDGKKTAGNLPGVKDERQDETTTAPKTEPTQTDTQISTMQTAVTEPEKLTFCLPLGTQINKDYSAGVPVYNKTMADWRLHNGADFAAEQGEDVKAAADGTVSAVRSDEMWGTVMEISHQDGTLTRYCGLEQGTTCVIGEKVHAGAVIGCLGTIPCENEDGFHLHFEVEQDGKIIDPVEVLTQDTVAQE